MHQAAHQLLLGGGRVIVWLTALAILIVLVIREIHRSRW
jgi:hypothetical protein